MMVMIKWNILVQEQFPKQILFFKIYSSLMLHVMHKMGDGKHINNTGKLEDFYI